MSQNDWLCVPGRIVKLFCTFTKPPKEKYVVIVATNPFCIGFLINSNPTSLQLGRSDLMAELIEIGPNGGYPFLVHKSYLDCTTVEDFESTDVITQVMANPHRDLKMISDDTREKIIKIMECSLSVEVGIAKIIIKALRGK